MRARNLLPATLLLLLAAITPVSALEANYDGPPSKIVFSSDRGGSWDLWTMDPADPSTLEQLTFGQNASFPRWSPDGTMISFWKDSNTACIVPADGGEPNCVGTATEPPLFWWADSEGDWRIYWPQRFAGIHWINITNGNTGTVAAPAGFVQPHISPIGDQLVFIPSYTFPKEIYVASFDGDAITNVVPIYSQADDPCGGSYVEVTLPSWSPDGTEVAFGRGYGGNTGEARIIPADPAITGCRAAATSYHFANDPRWSPDSRWLTYRDTSEGSAHVYIVPADGPADPIRLTPTDGGSFYSPDWSPVLNSPPEIVAISGPVDPVGIETSPQITLTFDDPDLSDSHDVTWDWGDETTDTQQGATSPATASHSYQSPGVYTVQVTVSDGYFTDAATYQYLVVYDPSAGFATGGGWLIPGGASSEVGDLLPGLDGTSKANFGFVVKYQNGASVVPSGHMEFHYNIGDFHLHSTDVEWLVVTNSNWAFFQGRAAINGLDGDYHFKVGARDATHDFLRIHVWAPEADPDLDDPIYKASGNLGGGQIKIHRR